MILTSLEVDRSAFEGRTGWTIKPQGACKGDLCVPMPAGAAAASRLDARILSERLGMPLVSEPEANLWALGPEAMGHALTTAKAPDLNLPDYQGKPFTLASLRGRKVLIVTWSSW